MNEKAPRSPLCTKIGYGLNHKTLSQEEVARVCCTESMSLSEDDLIKIIEKSGFDLGVIGLTTSLVSVRKRYEFLTALTEHSGGENNEESLKAMIQHALELYPVDGKNVLNVCEACKRLTTDLLEECLRKGDVFVRVSGILMKE